MSYVANGCIRLLLPWEPGSQEWIRGMVGWRSSDRQLAMDHTSALLGLRRCADRIYVPCVRGQRTSPDTCDVSTKGDPSGRGALRIAEKGCVS